MIFFFEDYRCSSLDEHLVDFDKIEYNVEKDNFNNLTSHYRPVSEYLPRTHKKHIGRHYEKDASNYAVMYKFKDDCRFSL
eukprot:12498950-Ditylum_brightwellii.AAC.1